MKHSAAIDFARCRGCTTCMKSCPAQAIRVRRGKATILDERCIDCGNCIKACPHKAIQAHGDSFERLHDFRYTVALPDPVLYGQFQNLEGTDRVLEALLKLGFDSVYEVAKGAGYISDYVQKHPEVVVEQERPVISSACPAVLRLIRTRFPDLLPHITTNILPMELAAILARREAVKKTGLKSEEIGVFAIVPCSAQVTAIRHPDDLQAPVIDGAFSIRKVYVRLLSPMQKIKKPKKLSSASRAGLRWSYSSGEADARATGERYLAVDGMDNVISILAAIEDERVPDVDFVELSACTQGCVGGCLTAEDPFVAAMRLRNLIDNGNDLANDFDAEVGDPSLLQADKELEFAPVYLLDEDRAVAMEKMAAIHELERQLPGLLCGSCGAPSCHAFAEDVVLGRADRSDCIFQVRARVQKETGADMDEYLPAPFRRQRPEEKKDT